MRCLTVQIPAEFIGDFDRTEFLFRVRKLGRSPEIDAFNEGGKHYLSFHFFTEMPVRLWSDLRQFIYGDPDYGPIISACSIAVCDGATEADEDLLLHHFDPAEPRASLN